MNNFDLLPVERQIELVTAVANAALGDWGMSGAQVASILGSPNIVSTDGNRDEVWIYDKFATDAAYSKSRTGLLGLVIGTSGDVGAGGLGIKTHSAGASSRSQRTLTVVIKFDGNRQVRDFAYHTARF